MRYAPLSRLLLADTVVANYVGPGRINPASHAALAAPSGHKISLAQPGKALD